jgi:L-iditol 2-dehydrogenase
VSRITSRKILTDNPSSGAGPIGLVTLLAARAAGCEPIVITDLFPSRLEFAKKLVPGVRTVVVDMKDTPEEIAGKVKAAAGMEVRVAMECTGVESSIRAAIFVSPLLSA